MLYCCISTQGGPHFIDVFITKILRASVSVELICIFFWLTRTNLGSKSKRHKLSKKQNVMQCEDRISNLPSNVIGRILSSVPTKSAVATSVLSTRWKQYWTLVTSLEFDCPEDGQEIDSELPMFPNLTSLVLGAGYVGWEWLSQFLEKSPRLESLVFKEGYQIQHDGDEYDEEDDNEGEDDSKGSEGGDDSEGEDVNEGEDKPLLCHPPQNVPSCLRLNLKVIKFVNFQGDGGQLKMVEYFLKNAEVLEKLIVQTDGTVDECFDMGGAGLAVAEQQLEITAKLLMLPRVSKTCQIEFVILRHDFDGSESPY
ncbi:hypothetical protein RHMOL_Rhmol04G0286900 [Rhododendron molle]|uniref:Uncharacterized protein n=1 Tax=Rhododendron molle TaxID=49168 RepID=A0ACC0P6R6_RHOML|nr:hypothetical protein RHMOL_Rhmol04G0286900 [Rhododendron molle]